MLINVSLYFGCIFTEHNYDHRFIYENVIESFSPIHTFSDTPAAEEFFKNVLIKGAVAIMLSTLSNN